MEEHSSLAEVVDHLRGQAGWWLACNSISRNKVHEEETLRPQSMIVFEVHVLDGLRILGFTDEPIPSRGLGPREGRQKGFPVPITLTETEFARGRAHGHSLDNILVELVRVEGSDGRCVLDFLAALWPAEWLADDAAADGPLRDHTLSIFSPFGIHPTTTLLALSKHLRQSGFLPQREYEAVHVERTIRGHAVSFEVWRFEKGKGLCIRKSFTIRLLLACWLPPFLVILGLCVLHLLNPDIGLGDILSLVGAALSALAAWMPGVVLKGWQLGDAIRGNYYTTNLDTAQEVSTSTALKLASCTPSLCRSPATHEARLEPASLIATAVQRGDAAVEGNGGCYFGLVGELGATFSPLQITCNSGVPLEVLVLEPLGTLKIPIPRKGRGTTQAYINKGLFKISEIQRKSEATVHLDQPWQADLPKLQVLLSTRRSSYRPYQTNSQLGRLVLEPHSNTTTAPRKPSKSSKSRFGNSYMEDVALLTRVLRGGQNLLLGDCAFARSSEDMV